MAKNFKEKKESKIIRYKELANKYKSQSEAMHDRANKLSEVLQGEPIKRGHHSERRHRKHLQMMHGYMDRARDKKEKALYYDQKAKASENYDAINSDDPEAIEKLKNKIAQLEKDQQLMKEVNKIVRSKKLSLSDKIIKLSELGILTGAIYELLTPDMFGNVGFAQYKLTNNNNNIRHAKNRLQSLVEARQIEDQEEIINNVIFRINQDLNRVQLEFQGIPEKGIRDQLKQHGFKWSPSLGTWQRKISNEAINAAKRILNDIS